MAAFHFAAFPELTTGLAQLNGAPYGCQTQLWAGEVETLRGPCHTGKYLNVTALAEYITVTAEAGLIGDLSLWLDKPIFLVAGDADVVVDHEVVEKSLELYSQYSSKVTYRLLRGLDHAFATDRPVRETFFFPGAVSPILRDLGVDEAGHLLMHLLGPLRPRGKAQRNNLRTVLQHDFVPKGWNSITANMDEVGFVYAPSACQERPLTCRMHVVYHGCYATASNIGDGFYWWAGYNDWAESNNLIILYPQAAFWHGSKACWDYYGYTGAKFDTRQSSQLVTVNNMVRALYLRRSKPWN